MSIYRALEISWFLTDGRSQKSVFYIYDLFSSNLAMLNYSLEVFYPSTLFQIYHTTVLIMLVINTLVFVFISYAIIFHGKMLGVYRWLLLIVFILSYAVDFVLALGH